MTINYGTCDAVTISSTNLVSTNQSVTLNIKYNCDKEWELDIPVTDTTITINPSDIDTTDFIPDGIYYFKLTITVQNGDKIIESACKFVNCITNCEIVDAFRDKDCDRTMAYYALVASKDCPSCNCEDLCTLYKIATKKPCEYVSPCGC
jgi:hypothetical protein